MTQNKGNGCRKICILCQQTLPKRWFGNMERRQSVTSQTGHTKDKWPPYDPEPKPPPWKFSAYTTGLAALSWRRRIFRRNVAFVTTNRPNSETRHSLCADEFFSWTRKNHQLKDFGSCDYRWSSIHGIGKEKGVISLLRNDPEMTEFFSYHCICTKNNCTANWEVEISKWQCWLSYVPKKLYAALCAFRKSWS